jgi:hypothetical protein
VPGRLSFSADREAITLKRYLEVVLAHSCNIELYHDVIIFFIDVGFGNDRARR